MEKQHIHYDQHEDEELNELKAIFSFTDVDGNRVTGIYRDTCICDILDHLGSMYLYCERLHPVEKPLMGNFNGVADITKPIQITIQAKGSTAF